jgi:hypothetical protein
LESKVLRFDPVSPLGPQVGQDLYAYLAIGLRAPIYPTSPLDLPPYSLPQTLPQPITQNSLALIPPKLRLAWLIEVFFDVDEDCFDEDSEDFQQQLARTRSLLEPVLSTDLRVYLREQLERTPPSQVRILPFGNESASAPRPSRRWYLMIPVLFLLAAMFGGYFLGLWQKSWDWTEAATLHQQILASPGPLPGFIQENNPNTLSSAFQKKGLGPLLWEVPDLSARQLLLSGGLILEGEAPAVVLYYSRDGLWTLQHHLRPDPTEPTAFVPGDPDTSTLTAWSQGGVSVVGWRDPTGLWVLGSQQETAFVLEEARAIQQLLHPPSR